MVALDRGCQSRLTMMKHSKMVSFWWELTDLDMGSQIQSPVDPSLTGLQMQSLLLIIYSWTNFM
jgi:hypothetical protein